MWHRRQVDWLSTEIASKIAWPLANGNVIATDADEEKELDEDEYEFDDLDEDEDEGGDLGEDTNEYEDNGYPTGQFSRHESAGRIGLVNRLIEVDG